jgi:hypothetical protein
VAVWIIVCMASDVRCGRDWSLDGRLRQIVRVSLQRASATARPIGLSEWPPLSKVLAAKLRPDNDSAESW